MGDHLNQDSETYPFKESPQRPDHFEYEPLSAEVLDLAMQNSTDCPNQTPEDKIKVLCKLGNDIRNSDSKLIAQSDAPSIFVINTAPCEFNQQARLIRPQQHVQEELEAVPRFKIALKVQQFRLMFGG